MRKKQLTAILSIFLLPLSAVAGHQVCGNREVPANVSRCPDGSIPMYIADEIKPYVPSQSVQEPSQSPRQQDSSMFDRDWRLYVPGAAYQTENVVAGTRTLHVSPGSGKLHHVLKISANGTYVWTANGQMIHGAWVPGDKGYPVLLQNGYEGKNWKATMSNGQLLLWDGNSLAGQFLGR